MKMRHAGRGAHAMHYGLALVAVLALSAGPHAALAETQSVIDPVEAPEPQKPPQPEATVAPEPNPAVKRERQRAKEEQRKRTEAAARATAAEDEAAKLRAAAQAQRAKAAARKAAAAKEAAAREAAARAQAARLAKARLAAQKEAARKEALRQAIAREAAMKEAASREALARETAARETAAKEAAAREAAAREKVAREAAAREAATRELAAAREAAAKEAAAREAAAKEAVAREAAVREAAVREAAARETAARLAAANEAESRAAAAQPVFRDCAECPEVVKLPKGEVSLAQPGSTAAPRYVTRVNYTLAVGRFKVSYVEWDACVADGGCRRRGDEVAWDRVRQPVTNVSWEDAQQYAAWLSRRTSRHYRLLTGAEWEYAARAGAELHDMQGSVSEWVENCYQYRDARTGGKAWTLECTNQVLRGGAQYAATATRVARSFAPFNYSDSRIGFRVARTD